MHRVSTVHDTKFNTFFFQIPTLWGIARHFFAVILHLYFKHIIININIKRMKTFRFNFSKFAVAVAGMLLLCACPLDPDSLSVSQKEFTFEADDTGNQSAEITTSAESWQAESSYSWLSLSPSGNRLSISVEKYTSTEGPRTGEIIIQAGTAEPVSISVTQKAQHSLSLSPESLSFEPDGSAQEVTITTTAPSWEATKKTDADWFSFSKQDNKLTVTVDKNTNMEGREATIKITAGNAAEKTLTVTQGKSHTLTVSPTSLSFEANGIGEESVTITTTAPSWDAVPSDQWVQVDKQGSTLKVKVTSENSDPSSRSATIKITAGTAPERTINVTQKAHTLSVSRSSLSFGASETAAQSVTVTTTVSSWNAAPSDSWIQLTKQGNTINVTVSSNSSTSDRSGTIRVTAGTLERTVTVTQNGVSHTLSVSPTSISFVATSPSAQTVTVTTNAPSWNATTTASWLTLTQQSNTLRVSATSNSSTSSRSATIRFTAGNAPERTVTVTQAAPIPDPPFIPISLFTATGISTTGASISWSGIIGPMSNNNNKYGITNWGDVSVMVYIDYISSRLILDNSTKVATSTDGYDLYFKAIAVNSARNEAELVPGSYVITYNTSTKTLDFSGPGTYNGNPVYVGLVASLPNQRYGTIALVRNAKLVLTSLSSTPALDANNALKSNLNSNGNLLRIDKMVVFDALK
jgi:hypothetical protein